jgi:GNAT superfamily N-acetyltransferase
VVKIRRIKKDDKDELLKLIREFSLDYNRGEFLKGKPILEFEIIQNEKGYFEQALDETMNLINFVAEDDGKLVGYVAGKIRNFNKYRKYHKQGYIEDLFVTKDYRGTGLGKQLFETMIDELRSLGCQFLATSSYYDNNNACQFYKKYGFIEKAVIYLRKL